jgi:hypothetical protein
MTHLRYRIASALAAAVCIAIARESYCLCVERSFRSPLLLMTLVSAVTVGAALAVLAVAPARWWSGLIEMLKRFAGKIPTGPLPTGGAASRLLFAAGAVTFLLMAVHFVRLQQSYSDDDQAAYLSTAGEIHDSGGIPALVAQMFRGDYEEANRHPLYIALLSFRPTFEGGKVLSASIGAVSLGLLTWLAVLRFGAPVAAVFCILLATNFAFCRLSSMVVCEGLMLLFGGVIWLFSIPRGPRNATETQSQDVCRPGAIHPLCVGALLALAYLSKGTGIVLLVGYLVWYFLPGNASSKRGAERVPLLPRLAARGRPLVLLLLAWVLVASPLLVRNVRRYGRPLFNVNSYLLFVDAYQDPVRLHEETTLADAASRYFQTHSPGDILWRELRGLAWEIFIFCRSLGPTPLDDSRILFGIPLCLLAAIGAFTVHRRALALYAVWLLLYVVLLAWYVPIAAGERFLMPLLAPTLTLASIGIVRSGQWLGNGARRMPTVGAAAGVLWCVTWLLSTYLSTSLPERVDRGRSPAGSEQRVDEGSHTRTAQHDQNGHQEQYENDRRKPPFLVRGQKQQELAEYSNLASRGLLFELFGLLRLVGFDRFVHDFILEFV